jgi:hypothetical protein
MPILLLSESADFGRYVRPLFAGMLTMIRAQRPRGANCYRVVASATK